MGEVIGMIAIGVPICGLIIGMLMLIWQDGREGRPKKPAITKGVWVVSSQPAEQGKKTYVLLLCLAGERTTGSMKVGELDNADAQWLEKHAALMSEATERAIELNAQKWHKK